MSKMIRLLLIVLLSFSVVVKAQKFELQLGYLLNNSQKSVFNQNRGPYVEIGYSPKKSRLNLALGCAYFRDQTYFNQRNIYVVNSSDTLRNIVTKESYDALSILFHQKYWFNKNKKIKMYINTAIGDRIMSWELSYNPSIPARKKTYHFLCFQSGIGFGIPLDKNDNFELRCEFVRGVVFSNLQKPQSETPDFSKGNLGYVNTRLGLSVRL